MTAGSARDTAATAGSGGGVHVPESHELTTAACAGSSVGVFTVLLSPEWSTAAGRGGS